MEQEFAGKTISILLGFDRNRLKPKAALEASSRGSNLSDRVDEWRPWRDILWFGFGLELRSNSLSTDQTTHYTM